jgi:hypothetical protein
MKNLAAIGYHVFCQSKIQNPKSKMGGVFEARG